jgi:hypothetical protein
MSSVYVIVTLSSKTVYTHTHPLPVIYPTVTILIVP